MIVEIKVPDLGESISEVEIGEWAFNVGDTVQQDDPVVDVESEKATLAIPAPEGGVLVEIVKKQGATAAIGEVIGHIDTENEGVQEDDTPEPPESKTIEEQSGSSDKKVMPSAARVMAQNKIAPEEVTPTGPGERILKEDALLAVAKTPPSVEVDGETGVPESPPNEKPVVKERRVPMSLIRRTIAARLLQAQQGMAILTTFNEVDMSEVKKLRATLGAEFADKYGVRLGFMSFFVKAAVSALKDFPLVNARIDGDDIVYRDYCDIGVAIGGGKGLVVPVIREAQQLNFAQIEQQIVLFGEKAKKNTLTIKDLEGGTFTISNGGVYGSMLSTPIVNPPQSAILGLHAIKDRPVAIDGEVRIRPVMYLALSYDHRIIDGREAVSFLKSIKERIEDPQKLLLEI
ncbi:MAG: 2-oxoglutarate dehydrogenase complex dihydrolipoyllysine-residue succinyltransferase [Desulforhopalus sp.]